MTAVNDFPEGFRLMDRAELVQDGDLWCHQGKVNRQWLPARLFGEQLPNNDYCRRETR